jgi:hypothetical protein
MPLSGESRGHVAKEDQPSVQRIKKSRHVGESSLYDGGPGSDGRSIFDGEALATERSTRARPLRDANSDGEGVRSREQALDQECGGHGDHVGEDSLVSHVDGDAEGSTVDSDFKIFPRRKGGQSRNHTESAPVIITAELLQSYYNMPLVRAAKKLGICTTALKKVCRKLGIHKWPYKEMKPALSLCRQAESSGSGKSAPGSSDLCPLGVSITGSLSPPASRREPAGRHASAHSHKSTQPAGAATGGNRACATSASAPSSPRRRNVSRGSRATGACAPRGGEQGLAEPAASTAAALASPPSCSRVPTQPCSAMMPSPLSFGQAGAAWPGSMTEGRGGRERVGGLLVSPGGAREGLWSGADVKRLGGLFGHTPLSPLGGTHVRAHGQMGMRMVCEEFGRSQSSIKTQLSGRSTAASFTISDGDSFDSFRQLPSLVSPSFEILDP